MKIIKVCSPFDGLKWDIAIQYLKRLGCVYLRKESRVYSMILPAKARPVP